MKDALYVPVSIVSDFELKISEQSQKQDIYKMYASVHEEIKSLAVTRIQKKQRIINCPKIFLFFCYSISKWQKWGDIEEVKKWIDDLICDRKGILIFLEGMWNFHPDGNFHKIDEIKLYTDPSKLLKDVKSIIDTTETDHKNKILQSYIESYNRQKSNN